MEAITPQKKSLVTRETIKTESTKSIGIRLAEKESWCRKVETNTVTPKVKTVTSAFLICRINFPKKQTPPTLSISYSNYNTLKRVCP